MACRVYFTSTVRRERQVEEGGERMGKAEMSAEEARRRETEWRRFMVEVKRGRGCDGGGIWKKWFRSRACFVEIEEVEERRKFEL